MNRELPGFEQAIERVVAVVGVMACGALFDQAAGRITQQLGAQGAGVAVPDSEAFPQRGGNY